MNSNCRDICCNDRPFLSALFLGLVMLIGSDALGQDPAEDVVLIGSSSAKPSVSSSVDEERPPRWWKGNLHTHSFWSDGNDFPEMISDWYRTKGYSFLAISDHNVLQSGSRWMKTETVVARGGSEVIPKYRSRFGTDWLEFRGEPNTSTHEIRLKPLDEYRYLLEQHDQFILIPSEEVSDKAEGKPVHMNATNLAEVIKPVGGATVREAMENNIRAVLDQEKRLGREILMHLNHPNFHYAITFEDLAGVMSERFFEVYNGHPGVNHQGDQQHPGVERIWDLANHLRVNKLGGSILWGIATDDSHEYHGKKGSRPGRGWVMVRSRYLTPEHLIRAMKVGDFYASSGVALDDVRWDSQTNTLSVKVLDHPNETIKTEYIVTDREADTDRIGRVVYSSTDRQSSYQLQPGESIVRAVITSSLPPDDPVWEGQKQQAWTQPFVATDKQVRIEKGISYLEEMRSEKADLYLPPNMESGKRYPGIVIIHGGGWTGGKRDAVREINIGTTLASQGYVCLSIDYVLQDTQSSKLVWPQNLHDCKTAVRWLRANAERLKLDPENIGVIGGSAGGHLSAMVGVTQPRDGLDPAGPYGEHSCAVKCVVDLYGPSDVNQWKDVPALLQKRSDAPELYKQFSVTTYLDPKDPPFLILHGTADTTVPVSQSELLAAELKLKGIEHHLEIIEGAPHTFHLQPKQKDLRPLVIAFFDQHLKAK